jgi:hypothetical protein
VTGQPPPASGRKPKVFIDADVLFAGSAAPSEYGASLVVLSMAEITLLEAYTCRQVITETERNLVAKLPRALPAFRLIVDRCLRIVPDPHPEQAQAFAGLANPVDLPILVAALQQDCSWLVTFNTRHYQPRRPEVSVLPPGDFLLRVRDLLVQLG